MITTVQYTVGVTGERAVAEGRGRGGHAGLSGNRWNDGAMAGMPAIEVAKAVTRATVECTAVARPPKG